MQIIDDSIHNGGTCHRKVKVLDLSSKTKKTVNFCIGNCILNRTICFFFSEASCTHFIVSFGNFLLKDKRQAAGKFPTIFKILVDKQFFQDTVLTG